MKSSKALQKDDPNLDIIYERLQGNPPDVTVIISLYNYQQYIEECLESVKRQTLKPIDLIVVDDCSKDNSIAIVKRWMQQNHSRFQLCCLYRHKQNKGLAQTRNSAFAQARTPYVFVLDADNSLYPRCLERHLAVLSGSDAAFAYSYLEVFGAVRGLQNTIRWNKETLQYGNTVDAMVLMRKNAWQQAGGYSVMEVMGWEDYDLWFKIARNGGWGILVPEILARYRVHSKSMLRTITNPKSDRLREILLDSYPEFYTDPYVRVDILSKVKRFHEAIPICLEILAKKPDDSDIWKHLLWLYFQTEQLAEYKDAAVKMLLNCPETVNDLVDNPYLEIPLLKTILKQAIQENSNKALFHQALAKVNMLEGNAEQCIENAKIARKLSQHQKEQLKRLIETNQTQTAQSIIDQWVKEEPQSQEALFYKALSEAKQKKYYSALRIFEQLTKSGNREAAVLENFIDVALRANKKGLALKLIEEFILLEPNEEWKESLRRLASNYAELHIFGHLCKYVGVQPYPKHNPAETLQLLLQADDLLEAFQQHSHRFDQELIDYIRQKATEASHQQDQEFASLLLELAGSIEQWVNQDQLSYLSTE